jgi:hypothetical protein
MAPLSKVENGQYWVKLVRAVKCPPRYGRTDLLMNFRILEGSHEGVVLPAYYQVTWLDERTFTAGPKSNYFRDYQACIGSVAGKSCFTTEDFEDRKCIATVKQVVKDADGEPLAPLNQYSRVHRLRERVDED